LPPFSDIFKIMSAIDDAYFPISACIDTIQTQNKTLTIWLLQKVYYRLLSGFICLQLIIVTISNNNFTVHSGVQLQEKVNNIKLLIALMVC